MNSPNTSKRKKIGNIYGVDIISDPSYKSDEIGIARRFGESI